MSLASVAVTPGGGSRRSNPATSYMLMAATTRERHLEAYRSLAYTAGVGTPREMADPTAQHRVVEALDVAWSRRRDAF